MARLNPQGLAVLRQRLGTLALAGAEAGAEELRQKLTGAGHGRHYARQPHRSSAEGEYPAEQTGALRDSIAARPAGEVRAEFGPISNPPPYTLALHFKPPDDGGRPFLDDAVQDRDIRAAILAAVGVRHGRGSGR